MCQALVLCRLAVAAVDDMFSVSCMRLPARVRIIEKKLGRERALGQAWAGLDVIEIDPRQDERERLDTLIHELLHVMMPEWSEETVVEAAKWLSRHLWKQRYRRMR